MSREVQEQNQLKKQILQTDNSHKAFTSGKQIKELRLAA